MLGAEEASPCRHAGAPTPSVIARVNAVIAQLGDRKDLLEEFGLSPAEFQQALPAAIEASRGSRSAGQSNRRLFVRELLQQLVQDGAIRDFVAPKPGEDTVYRLKIDGFDRDVGIIQKGCPDGAHSSKTMTVPEWAGETYLWWLCDSLANEPGEHVHKGVGRLQSGFFDENARKLAGVIFYNHLCGSLQRECPKARRTLVIDGNPMPPPCIYVMPDWDGNATAWNWNGLQERAFPTILLRAFGVPEAEVPVFTGQIGFRHRPNSRRAAMNITSRFGISRTTQHRS
ncbi:hypothetical protein [Streptomyces sp. NPDC088910]|uniref:hypothetical protein n=1 Tax=Streptomyces sp. NPDC088910 TaxID=3365911 RepID=UPI00380E9BDD